MSDMLERAARAMWERHADEPLQVGKFKEPTDYREYSDLGEPAKEMLRGYVRAALKGALDAGFVLVPKNADVLLEIANAPPPSNDPNREVE